MHKIVPGCLTAILLRVAAAPLHAIDPLAPVDIRRTGEIAPAR